VDLRSGTYNAAEKVKMQWLRARLLYTRAKKFSSLKANGFRLGLYKLRPKTLRWKLFAGADFFHKSDPVDLVECRDPGKNLLKS
jgi:hypothetical protein